MFEFVDLQHSPTEKNMELSFKVTLVLLSLVALATGWRCGSSGPSGTWDVVDMTQPLNNYTLSTRFADYFRLYTTFYGEKQSTDGEPYWYEAYRFCAIDHSGTHIDAPSHFYADVKTIDQIPLKQLVDIPVAKIDVTAKVRANNEYNLVIEDIMSWEDKYGKLPPKSFVFMYSGYGKFYGDRLAFMGTDTEDRTKYKFPAFSPEVIDWLIEERDINGVGTESFSVESVQGLRDLRWDVHISLAEVNKIGIENLANMEKLPEYGACVTALPMKLDGGSGAPTRVVAKFNPDPPRRPNRGASDLKIPTGAFTLFCFWAIAIWVM